MTRPEGQSLVRPTKFFGGGWLKKIVEREQSDNSERVRLKKRLNQMKHTLLSIILFCAIAFPSFAEGPSAPDTLSDTLHLMQQELLQRPDVEAAILDLQDNSLALTTKNGGSLTLYPDNLHVVLLRSATNEIRQQVLSDFITNLLTSHLHDDLGEDADLDMDHVLPVLRHKNFLAFADGADGSAKLVNLPGKSIGDMVVLYVEDSPQSVAFVTEDTLENAGISPDVLHDTAMKNLLAYSENLTVEGESVYQLKLDGFYEGSMMLDSTIWQSIDDQIGGITLIYPNRDTVAFVSANWPGGERILRDYVAENAGQNPYEVSSLIYQWAGDHWRVMQ